MTACTRKIKITAWLRLQGLMLHNKCISVDMQNILIVINLLISSKLNPGRDYNLLLSDTHQISKQQKVKRSKNKNCVDLNIFCKSNVIIDSHSIRYFAWRNYCQYRSRTNSHSSWMYSVITARYLILLQSHMSIYVCRLYRKK